MRQPHPAPAHPLVEWLRGEGGRRALGLGLALFIEGLLLLLLLSLGMADRPQEAKPDIAVVNIEARDVEEQPPEPSESAEPEQKPQPVEEPPTPEQPSPEPPIPVRIAETVVAPPAPAVIPTPVERPPSADVYPRPIQPAPPSGRVYGPPNTGGSAAAADTARVGTAPNGEPLYAAAWYREPAEDELRGYLSTASGPGWGLIACRTAPDYRVEDCVALAEHPQGSQINRAVLAAAWQFKVRPPRLGGRPQIGTWVRIRIDYGVSRR